MTLYIFSGAVLVLILYLISIYNGMIRYKNMVKNAWSGIDVQLKRRTDLIPNLVETVKGYTTHERDLLQRLTEARTSVLNAGGNVKNAAIADNQLTSALKSLFMVAEAYPDLKANQNYLKLQEEISETEDQVAASRRIYNENVNYFNTKIEVFPNNLVAGIFSFKPYEFFITDDAEKSVVSVKF
jgi:LemA protein